MNLVHAGQLSEGLGIPQWDVNDSVVAQGRHGSNAGRFLSTTKRPSGYENAGVLAMEATGGPNSTSFIPEGLVVRMIEKD